MVAVQSLKVGVPKLGEIGWICCGMDAINQLREDVRDGRVTADSLVDLVVHLQQQLQVAQQQLQTVHHRIEELKKKLGGWRIPNSINPFPSKRKNSDKRHAARKNAPRSQRDGGAA